MYSSTTFLQAFVVLYSSSVVSLHFLEADTSLEDLVHIISLFFTCWSVKWMFLDHCLRHELRKWRVLCDRLKASVPCVFFSEGTHILSSVHFCLLGVNLLHILVTVFLYNFISCLINTYFIFFHKQGCSISLSLPLSLFSFLLESNFFPRLAPSFPLLYSVLKVTEVMQTMCEAPGDDSIPLGRL